jgi:hypothetical protein
MTNVSTTKHRDRRAVPAVMRRPSRVWSQPSRRVPSHSTTRIARLTPGDEGLASGEILLATARLDQHPHGSDEFRAHQQTIMRELRMLGLYPTGAAG